MSASAYPRTTRPALIVRVYSELRGALGHKVSGAELLACAAAIVEQAGQDPDEPEFDLHIGGLPFDMWSTDVALADGGWRLLNREAHLYADEDCAFENASRVLRGLAPVHPGSP